MIGLRTIIRTFVLATEAIEDEEDQQAQENEDEDGNDDPRDQRLHCKKIKY